MKWINNKEGVVAVIPGMGSEGECMGYILSF